MDPTDLHARLMDDAQHLAPADHDRSRLASHRDVLLIWRAKRMSYERIAATLTKHGLKVSPTSVGVFCRRTFIEAEVLRERSRFETETLHGPAATAPSSPGLFAVAMPMATPATPGQRGPKIARDNY
jgi:hypothetical protein